MLEDFVKDLRDILNERLTRDRDLNEGTSTASDMVRGRIQAWKQTFIDIDELLKRYAEDEVKSVPEHIKPVGPQPRRYGRRAA